MLCMGGGGKSGNGMLNSNNNIRKMQRTLSLQGSSFIS